MWRRLKARSSRTCLTTLKTMLRFVCAGVFKKNVNRLGVCLYQFSESFCGINIPQTPPVGKYPCFWFDWRRDFFKKSFGNWHLSPTATRDNYGLLCDGWIIMAVSLSEQISLRRFRRGFPSLPSPQRRQSSVDLLILCLSFFSSPSSNMEKWKFLDFFVIKEFDVI